MSDLLNRLIVSNKAGSIGSVLQAELCKPLLIHPPMVESYVRGFLLDSKAFLQAQESIDDIKMDTGMDVRYMPEINTGVIYINGAMSNHIQTDFCGYTPSSYDGIREGIELLESRGMEHLIGMFETGGGVASGMFKLARELKSIPYKTTAVIDDYAYSAGMGLASAFDDIRITETTGMGSIGVVVQHQYITDDKVSTEYIHYGSKKVDGNPYSELSNSAREDMQAEVNRLGDMFVQLISENLGLEKSAVKAMEAGTYHGENIIKAGLAHQFGDFQSVIDDIYRG